MKTEILSIDQKDEKAILKTYILDDYPKYYQQQKRPAVVICPGGGYATLARKEGEPVALKMNGMGYHAFVLQYSVIFKEKPKNFEKEEELPEINPNAYFPTQIYQLRNTLALIREHAEEWNVDKDQLILLGFSAGGHLVASYLTFGKDILAENYIKPKAAVLGYARTNMAVPDWKEKFATVSGRTVTKYKYLCQFKTTEPTMEQRLAIDPYINVHKDMPPVFLWHSVKDTSVNALCAITFAQKLFETGVPVELHLFAGGVHGCALADKESASTANHYDEGCEQWTNLLQIWLKRILVEDSREKKEKEEQQGKVK